MHKRRSTTTLEPQDDKPGGRAGSRNKKPAKQRSGNNRNTKQQKRWQ
ncbi:hypothetical protein OO006_04375 [Prosthecochloris sp. SCSIO W1101]|nr:hypothetical protein [Prosthecochloris sp. SCSIO W1101]UZJ42217.1 hypothetical protein OO006_04375 [Prosthecochloris sp. SCSIO W1101]